MYKDKKIAVVIPCYKVSKSINKVVSTLPNFIDKIYLISDACPENSLNFVKSKSKKIVKKFRKNNGGVGAAVKDGYKLSLNDKNHITVRIDGDGQMDPKLIKNFINPIINKKAAFTKGNRFLSLQFFNQMPYPRIVGNILFSLMGNVLIKNFKIFDFLNGYTSINNIALKKVLRKKLENDFYFETNFIYQLNRMGFKILDVKIKAKYENENSNINIIKTGSTIFLKNIIYILGIKK